MENSVATSGTQDEDKQNKDTTLQLLIIYRIYDYDI
jgi:hypothetical protein